MGMKEGILEKKFVQDENVVSEKFIESFNQSIKVKRLIGRLAYHVKCYLTLQFRMLEYILTKLVPDTQEEKAILMKSFNEIVDRVGKDDAEKLAEDIETLMKNIKKVMADA